MNYYERTVLYKEVWSEPMGVVAARYGISDVMLKKICRKLEVPTLLVDIGRRLKQDRRFQHLAFPSHQGKTGWLEGEQISG